MPFAELSTGARLFYDDVGKPDGSPNGEIVLAIHGWLGTARFDLGNVVDWLVSEGYHVIGPTRRGYGESLPKPRDYPDDFYHRDAADMLAFMDALGLAQGGRKIHLLGYSDGGETALIMAGRAPERFASVAVWGAVGYFGEKVRAASQNAYPADWMTEDDKTRNGITDANAYVLTWIRAMKAMVDAGGDVSLHLAPNITAPLLVMLGEQDTLNPQEYAERLVAAATHSPDARVVMFPCGHPIHREAWEAFQAAVLPFLQKYAVK